MFADQDYVGKALELRIARHEVSAIFQRRGQWILPMHSDAAHGYSRVQRQDHTLLCKCHHLLLGMDI